MCLDRPLPTSDRTYSDYISLHFEKEKSLEIDIDLQLDLIESKLHQIKIDSIYEQFDRYIRDYYSSVAELRPLKQGFVLLIASEIKIEF